MLQGKVARVLSAHEVAISIGANCGVEVGMKFDIMSDEKEDILDPDTNDVLGSLDRPKVRVMISRVTEKFAVASTYRKVSINLGGVDRFEPSYSRLLSPPRWIKRVETLKTKE